MNNEKIKEMIKKRIDTNIHNDVDKCLDYIQDEYNEKEIEFIFNRKDCDGNPYDPYNLLWIMIGWKKENVLKGYIQTYSPYIASEDILCIEKLDDLNLFKSDKEAAEQAKKDGIVILENIFKDIYPIYNEENIKKLSTFSTPDLENNKYKLYIMLNFVENFKLGCKFKCPFCLMKNSYLEKEFMFPKLDYLEEIIKRDSIEDIIHINGGGDPLFNFDKNKNYLETLFLIIKNNNKKIYLHTKDIETFINNNEFFSKYIDTVKFSIQNIEEVKNLNLNLLKDKNYKVNISKIILENDKIFDIIDYIKFFRKNFSFINEIMLTGDYLNNNINNNLWDNIINHTEEYKKTIYVPNHRVIKRDINKFYLINNKLCVGSVFNEKETVILEEK